MLLILIAGCLRVNYILYMLQYYIPPKIWPLYKPGILYMRRLCTS